MVLSLVAVGDERRRERVVEVEQWAELRREHFVGGKSIKELARATGLSRNTVRRALRSERPPSYERAPKQGVLEPFKDEIHRLLREDPKLPGVRVRELLEPLGCRAGKTVVDDYLREVRPLFAAPRRTFQRTVYRPGEICQFDVWQPARGGPGRARPDPPRLGRGRVPGLLARRRGRAGVLDADRGSAGRDRRLPAASGRVAEDVGLGSPGRHPRPRRAPDARRSRRSAGS